MYDISPFWDWLDEPPDYLLEDDMDEELEAWKITRGLRPNAPQSAIDAYQKYLEDMEWAQKNHTKF